MRKKYHELSLAKKFSLTSIGFFFLTILVLTVLIQFLYEKSVLNITSESYKEKFEIVSDNSQSILENSGKIAKVILTDEAIQNWFLQDSEESADQLKYKIQVEKRLDYLDALYPDKQYSSISVFDSYGHMVNSNSIRSEASKYEQFFNIIKENYNVKWLDLYEVSLGDYEKNGIGYIRYYRDYDSGLIKGYVLIEYQSPLLINNFAHIRYGETGSYLIADTDGNKKIENDQDVSGNISEEEYFQWAEDNKKGGKVFRIDGKRYLVTASVIPTLDWLMIGLTPVNELTKAGKAMTQIIYVVGIIAALISTFFSLRVSHSVTKPLIYLTDTMKKFGKGDLSVRVPVLYLAKGLADAEHVMYDKGTLVEATDEAQFVQKVIPPVFNRTYEHFCSHLHSPSGRKEVYPGIVETENTAYFIHPIFTTYQNWAPAWYKKILRNELDRMLPNPLIQHNGPSTTQVTVLDQEQENRRIVHVLHYVPVKKCKNLEIVDDIIPLYNLKITMTEEREVEKIYTIPDKQEVPFVQDGKKLEFTLKEIKGHQMTAVCYKN